MNNIVMLESLGQEYNKSVYKKFKQIIDKYTLIEEGDCIAVEVCLEKNALLLMNCMMKLQKEMKDAFGIKYFIVSDGKEVNNNVKNLLEQYQIHNVNIVPSSDKEQIYSKMKEVGCTKVALPINYTNLVNTTFMTFMQKKEVAKMHPMSESKEMEGLSFIRPLCLIEEHVVLDWMSKMEIEVNEEESLFARMALVEEGFVSKPNPGVARFHFAVYEGI